MNTEESKLDSQFRTEFERELCSLINKHSLESESNTADFILSSYMYNCLCAYNTAIRLKSKYEKPVAIK